MKKVCALVFIISVSFLWAADFWVDKDYTTWSQKECETLLTKSPWVFSNALFEANPYVPMTGGDQVTRERTVTFRFRFLSAKPVRMAIGRLQLLQKPGDSSLGEQIKGMVEQPADQANSILVQVEFSVTPPGDPVVRDIHSALLNGNLSRFRDSTVLGSSKNVIVPVVEYRAPNARQTNPIFVFPRVDEKGNPYFTGDEKWVSLRTEILNYKIYARNSVEKMKFRGTFEF